jgi:hypothetical protein
MVQLIDKYNARLIAKGFKQRLLFMDLEKSILKICH